MPSNRPTIEAEQMTCLGDAGSDGRLAFHSFRLEVFDLPALNGKGDQTEYAGEIMAVAVSEAGSAFQKLANKRAPDGSLTRVELDELNADLQCMADRLADAIAARTDAEWWLANQARFTEEHAYHVIVGTDGMEKQSSHPPVGRS